MPQAGRKDVEMTAIEVMNEAWEAYRQWQSDFYDRTGRDPDLDDVNEMYPELPPYIVE